MKKLLMLIGANVLMVTTITPMIANSNIVSSNTEIKSNNQQTNLSLNKTFTRNGGDEFIHNGEWWKQDYEIIFTPETFEMMINLTHEHPDDPWFFQEMIRNFSGISNWNWIVKGQLEFVWFNGVMLHKKEMMEQYTEGIYGDINRQRRWKIMYTGFNNNAEYLGFTLQKGDNKTYKNRLLDKFHSDFYNELKTQWTVSLGLLAGSDLKSIREGIQKLYPRVYTEELEIIKTETISISGGFLLKLGVKETSTRYSIGVIRNDFVYNTEANIEKINDKINNDTNVKIWNHHINDWNENVKRQLKEDVPKLSEAQKRIWKDNVAEQLKSYMLDLSIIMKVIDIELRLEDLDNVIKDIKKDLETLKAQIADINNKIADINDPENKECKYYGYAGTVASFIPVVGGIISSTASAFETVCEIVG